MIQKRHHFLLYALLALASCQKLEEESQETGFLELSSMDCLPAQERILTRAVDPDLVVEITLSDGTLVESFPAGSPAASGKIELAPGEYFLRATSTSSGSVVGDGEKGEAVYQAVQQFTVSASKTTYLQVKVPMVNTGISLVLPEGFSDSFDSYRFNITCGGRSVEILDGETAFFDPRSGSLGFECSLSAVNKDFESFSLSSLHGEALSPGTVYRVVYSFGTRSLELD